MKITVLSEREGLIEEITKRLNARFTTQEQMEARIEIHCCDIADELSLNFVPDTDTLKFWDKGFAEPQLKENSHVLRDDPTRPQHLAPRPHVQEH